MQFTGVKKTLAKAFSNDDYNQSPNFNKEEKSDWSKPLYLGSDEDL